MTPDQQGDIPEKSEQRGRKEYIEVNLGNLEEAFIKSIGEQSNPPRRSRDDSIKLIYDINSTNDWLDLIEGHDEHVCSIVLLVLPFQFAFLTRQHRVLWL